MGAIHIETSGSFGEHEIEIPGVEGNHNKSILQAIVWLLQLPSELE